MLNAGINRWIERWGILFSIFLITTSGNAEEKRMTNIYLDAVDEYVSGCVQRGDFGTRAFSGNLFLGMGVWAWADQDSTHFKSKAVEKLIPLAVDSFLKELSFKVLEEEKTLEEIYQNPPMVNVVLQTAHQGALAGFVKIVRDEHLSALMGDARLAAIKKSLDKHGAYWIKQDVSPSHEQPWAYAQAILNLTYAYLYSGERQYVERTGFWFKNLSWCLGADGGLQYMRDDMSYGPVYWYSDATVYELGFARAALIGEAGAQDLAQELDEMARRMVPYYKKYVIGNGYVEYYSVIWWKQLSRTTTKPYATAALAYMTADPQMCWLAQEGMSRKLFYDDRKEGMRTWLSAVMMREIDGWSAQKPAVDGYTFYDADRIGVRGRFGKFHYTLQAGPHAGTVAGGMLLNDTGELQSVLQRVTPVVRLDPDPKKRRDDLHSLFILSWSKDGVTQETRPAVGVVRAETVGAVGTRYHPRTSHWAEDGELQRRIRESQAWEMEQLWLATPDRMVGVVQIQCVAPSRAFGVALWNSFSEIENLTALDDSQYEADGMIYRVVEHDFARVGLAPSRAVIALDQDKKWHGLYLADEAGAQHFIDETSPRSVNYRIGQKWQAVVEVYPKENGPSETRVRTFGEMTGLESREGETTWLAVFNHQNSPEKITREELIPENAENILFYRGVEGEQGQFTSDALVVRPRETILIKFQSARIEEQNTKPNP